MSDMPKLTNIKTKEVSTVDRGANKKRFFLKKNDGGNMKELLEKLLNTEISKDAKEALKDIPEGSIGAVEAMVKLLEGSEGLPENVLIQISKAAGLTTPSLSDKEIDVLVEKKIKTDKENTDKIAKAKKEAEKGKIDVSKIDTTPEVKALMEALTKRQDVLENENKTQKEEIKKAHEQIEKAEREKVRKAAIEKAGEFKLVGGTEEIANILLSVEKDQRDKLEAVLKVANNKIKQGDLFKEIGSNLDTEGGDKLSKAAVQIRKDDPKLTKEQAMDKALTDNPDLFE